MQKVKILSDKLAQVVNEFDKPTESDYYKRKSEGENWGDFLNKQWNDFDKANPPLTYISDFEVKIGEVLDAEIVVYDTGEQVNIYITLAKEHPEKYQLKFKLHPPIEEKPKEFEQTEDGEVIGYLSFKDGDLHLEPAKTFDAVDKSKEAQYSFSEVKLIATRFARQSRLMNDVTSNDTITSFDNWFKPENFKNS